jgi:hypothetical protein
MRIYRIPNRDNLLVGGLYFGTNVLVEYGARLLRILGWWVLVSKSHFVNYPGLSVPPAKFTIRNSNQALTTYISVPPNIRNIALAPAGFRLFGHVKKSVESRKSKYDE